MKKVRTISWLPWMASCMASLREALFRFIENVLATDRFDPEQVNEYLAQEAT
jgi:hypothetical protein